MTQNTLSNKLQYLVPLALALSGTVVEAKGNNKAPYASVWSDGKCHRRTTGEILDMTVCKKNKNARIIAAAVISSVVVLAIILFLLKRYWWDKRQSRDVESSPASDDTSSTNSDQMLVRQDSVTGSNRTSGPLQGEAASYYNAQPPQMSQR